MLYAAGFTLFDKIINDAKLFIHIGSNGVFVDVVKKIKVKILNTALFKLLGKGGGRVIVAAYLVAGVFIGQIPAVSGVAAEGLPIAISEVPLW